MSTKAHRVNCGSKINLPATWTDDDTFFVTEEGVYKSSGDGNPLVRLSDVIFSDTAPESPISGNLYVIGTDPNFTLQYCFGNSLHILSGSTHSHTSLETLEKLDQSTGGALRYEGTLVASEPKVTSDITAHNNDTEAHGGKLHEHTNKAAIDKIGEDSGTPSFDGVNLAIEDHNHDADYDAAGLAATVQNNLDDHEAASNPHSINSDDVDCYNKAYTDALQLVTAANFSYINNAPSFGAGIQTQTQSGASLVIPQDELRPMIAALSEAAELTTSGGTARAGTLQEIEITGCITYALTFGPGANVRAGSVLGDKILITIKTTGIGTADLFILNLDN